LQQAEASYTDERKHEDVASDEYGYSEEEEESVRLKLEALGYLECEGIVCASCL
jgi:hypothetical protein